MALLRSRGPLFSLLVLAALLISPSQVLAQDSPADSQYDTCDSGSVACVQYIGDAPEAFTDNAGQGTSAVNDAMAGPPSSASTSGSAAPTEAGPSLTSASSVSASAPGDEGGAAEGDDATDGSAGGAAGQAGGLASITELPETGGAPFLVLVEGVLLLSGGLCALRMFR